MKKILTLITPTVLLFTGQASAGWLPGWLGGVEDPQVGVDKKFTDGELEWRLYIPYRDQGDHLKELIEQGRFKSASKLFNKYEESYFLNKPLFRKKTPYQKLEQELEILAKGISKNYDNDVPLLIGKIQKQMSLVEQSKASLFIHWGLFKSLLKEVESYNVHNLLKHDRFKLAVIDKLNSISKKFIFLLKDTAGQQFTLYDFTNKNFFDEYPVHIDEQLFISTSSEVIVNTLDTLSLSRSINLINEYDSNISVNHKKKILGVLLEKTLPSSSSKEIDIVDLIFSLKKLNGLGVDIAHSLPSKYKISFLDYDKDDPAVSITSTLPFIETDVISLFNKQHSPYLIILDMGDVLVIKTKEDERTVYGNYISGHSMVDNPKYFAAKERHTTASKKYTALKKDFESLPRGDSCEEIAFVDDMEANVKNIEEHTACLQLWQKNAPERKKERKKEDKEVGKAWNDKYSARSRLERTPKQIKKAIYKSYLFTEKSIDLEKNFKLKIYLIDRLNKKFVKVVAPHTELKSFKVAKGLNPSDSYYTGRFDSKSDIKSFLSKKKTFSLLDIIFDIPTEQTFGSYSDIEDLMQIIKSNHIKSKSSQYIVL